MNLDFEYIRKGNFYLDLKIILDGNLILEGELALDSKCLDCDLVGSNFLFLVPTSSTTLFFCSSILGLLTLLFSLMVGTSLFDTRTFDFFTNLTFTFSKILRWSLIPSIINLQSLSFAQPVRPEGADHTP